jgi:hypothetical protein
VRGAPREIQLVEIIRSDPDRDQFPHKFYHEVGVIVDAFEEYRLACERDAGVGETPASRSRLRSNLGRVVEVSHQIEGVVLGKESAEIGSDSLGQSAWDPGSEAENLHVGNGAQRAEDPSKAPVIEEKGVAAGNEYVPNLSMVADVSQPEGKGLICRRGTPSRATLPGAEPADHGALMRDQPEHSVLVPVNQVGHRGMGLLGKRINKPLLIREFGELRYRLGEEPVIRGADEAEIVRVHPHGIAVGNLIHLGRVNREVFG